MSERNNYSENLQLSVPRWTIEAVISGKFSCIPNLTNWSRISRVKTFPFGLFYFVQFQTVHFAVFLASHNRGEGPYSGIRPPGGDKQHLPNVLTTPQNDTLFLFDCAVTLECRQYLMSQLFLLQTVSYFGGDKVGPPITETLAVWWWAEWYAIKRSLETPGLGTKQSRNVQ